MRREHAYTDRGKFERKNNSVGICKNVFAINNLTIHNYILSYNTGIRANKTITMKLT